MKIVKSYGRFTLLTLTTLSILGTATTAALAEYTVVIRGPNGAAHVVQADHLPLDAKMRVPTSPHTFPRIVVRGPGGASHITAESKTIPNYQIISYPKVMDSTPIGGGSN
ncbi:hypothetical protein [Lyngbya confervoides]|uniref:Uncharacterized protein n=1 Tax=Lyngbya confervoides BDU141951 TaxID=1574623 RepID=A0ABD4T0K5_9CYAN|nr:hypothetical protein [Lyngbya confervoides]MCM1982054.1 hypothetical protein [Lyngbya confervoides BDU141951]